MYLPVKQGGFILPHDKCHTNTNVGTPVWPKEFERECQTGKLEGWKEGRKGKGCAARNVFVCNCKVWRIIKRRPSSDASFSSAAKIPRIINSEAATTAYLTHSVSPAQSLTGNPSACVAGESEKEKNKRGKEKKNMPATEIVLSGKSWKIHRGWCLIAERSTSWRSQTWGGWLSVWGWLIEYLEL